MPLPKEERYTLADVLTWDGQEHVELIDGAPIMMAPPSRLHRRCFGQSVILCSSVLFSAF